MRSVEAARLPLYALRAGGGMGKLWQKGGAEELGASEIVERFTVGDDYLLDRLLVNADCVASIAHAAMLEHIGVLSSREREDLARELKLIIEASEAGTFTVRRADEDCHTAIENQLTAVLGDAGKRIHTGRSRNDQVVAALRLYARELLGAARLRTLDLALSLAELAARHRSTPMPGRTHMQLAMPSSVGLWAGAFAEQLGDDERWLDLAYDLTNTSPLGSAAGYGVSLPLDREMVSEALGFREVQNNVLAVNISRGKTEGAILDALSQVMVTLSKLAQDLIVFSLPEFGYFGLPEATCTGSSIMPQKRNPDSLELVRARASTLIAQSARVKSIAAGLPSGYNRDLQETKEPFMKGGAAALLAIRVMELTVQGLEVREDRLRAGFRPEIYATDQALELVGRGMPFRDAYREVAAALRAPEGSDPGALAMDTDPNRAISRKRSTGMPGNLGLERCVRRLSEQKERTLTELERVGNRLRALVGRDVKLCPDS
jgi:argininosuccinate lyase